MTHNVGAMPMVKKEETRKGPKIFSKYSVTPGFSDKSCRVVLETVKFCKIF